MSMSVPFKGLIAGAAGAVVLTALHEITHRATPRAPRLDSLGMRAIAKISEKAATREAALGGDLAANTMYYSMAGSFGANAAPLTGAFLGLAAGMGSVTLPQVLGLGSAPTNRGGDTDALAVGMYVAGGLAAGIVYKALSKE